MSDQPPPPSTRDQHHAIARKLIDLGYVTRADRLAELSLRTGRTITVFAQLTETEAAEIILGLTAQQYARAQEMTLERARAAGWSI
jgi:hypothetical protein